MNGFRPVDVAKKPWWPFSGPRASTEMLQGIRATGRELAMYHDLFAGKRGVHPDCAVLHEHRCWLTLLHMMVTLDQFDDTNVVSAGLACRRVPQLQRAIRVNPTSPSFAGLQAMLQHALDDGGGLVTRDFSKHIADGAAVEASILKQHRLLREEQAENDKTGPKPKKPQGDD